MEINQLRIQEDLYIGIGMIAYVVYIIVLNWVYIKEYLHNKGGNEWED
jgi:hypothetical protein